MSRKPTAPGSRRDMDLRQWLGHLETTDRLAVTKTGRKLAFEIAGLANRHDGSRALVAPAPDGHAGGVVISGLLSRREWMAEALGVEPGTLLSAFEEAAQSPLPVNEVKTAPCQEVVHKHDIDLTAMLPIPTHNEHDSGAYITAGLMICRNPRTGIQNVAIHRLQVSGPRELGALLLPRHTLSFFTTAEEAGDDLEVAIVIGASPACLLASQAIVPMDFDELTVAGALGGAPLDVVRGISVDLFVPAQSEIVIEGRCRANLRRPEGPFGEFPQYYGERADRHVIEVSCVTTRQKPLFHTIVGGGLEHLILGGIPREATILKALQDMFSCVRDVHLAPGGTCRYHLYVKIKARHAGEAKNVLLGAFAAHYDIKHAIVVDEDVDIHDPEMVEWAVATRFQADRDLVVISGSQGSKLDPSSDNGFGAKMGLDATVPLDAPEFRFKRIRVPGEQELDLDAVIDPDAKLASLLGP
ncbi:UbiD family decarboxylase [uncultured Roseovarius sp.]|uniref:UbiD family decarboxylase n=1 Tax=uncultured Roseovarius sp. TaxID=293344 RepID=UPI002621856A|nr:UbiD family decarboxylase [uncultured Roseovarius sp.]